MKNYLITLDSDEEIIVQADSVDECIHTCETETGCSIDDFVIEGVISEEIAEMLGYDTI